MHLLRGHLGPSCYPETPVARGNRSYLFTAFHMREERDAKHAENMRGAVYAKFRGKLWVVKDAEVLFECMVYKYNERLGAIVARWLPEESRDEGASTEPLCYDPDGDDSQLPAYQL